MLDNTVLEVVIGLTFIYLLYSLLGTLLQEIVATNIGLRARLLQYAIRRMLNDQTRKKDKIAIIKKHGVPEPTLLSEAFYGHPLIKYLASDGWWPLQKIPAYISKETFSKVMVDLLRGCELQPGDVYNALITKSLNDGKIAWTDHSFICTQTLSYLKSLWIDAQGDVVKFKMLLEQWFEEMMERTTGWYKKCTQLVLLVIGVGMAAVFNIDTVKIVKKLEHSPKLRAQVVAQANDYAKAHPQVADGQTPAASQKVRDSLYNQAAEVVKGDGDVAKVNELLGLGWDNKDNTDGTTWLGWLLTALAISLGAPFWFDLLNKLMKLRSSTATKKDDTQTKAGEIPATQRVG
ncbi:hypothetical protein [Mucilaginibacter sp.]|uniref:hypothetical protein n=1 Tax=Mucilaginibacter sp. TaxID=1882438 RepID=UPI0026273EAC|nr:hypothetical protein [Mucilaginibacter sp.]MDB4922898.1 hypothetical protein [Mucilaginibacter sp.]